MSLATATLPSDPEDLRAFARSLQLEMQREIAVRDAELHAKTLHIEKLKAQLAVLKRARFGRSSEKIERAIEQLELTIGELEENQAQAAARATALGAEPAPSPADRASSARRPMPEHLPRETVTHAPPERCPECGGTRFGVIGTDEREVLEYVPASFRVVRHARPKLSCRACETVVQAPMPSLPIERGRPGPALLAHVLVAKYGDHQPLHRQSEIYARGGVTIDRSVMAGWVGEMAAKLDPVVQAIGAHVLAGTTLHADDTPVPVLDPGRGKIKEGRLWAVVRDERPWGSEAPPAVLYRYSPNRPPRACCARSLRESDRSSPDDRWASMPWRCSAAVAAISTPTATAASTGSTPRMPRPASSGYAKWRVGAMRGASSTRCTSAPARRRPSKPST